MHRLTLILSDLYLPAEEAEEVAAASSRALSDLALPELEWLLRFARTRERIADWRSWLASELGLAPDAGRSRAAFAGPAGAWFATPVHLHAAMDHVRLDARGVLSLPAEERAAWIDAFARGFGPAFALHDDGVGGFFLTGLVASETATVDPARLLGADIARGIPRGAGSAPLRRLAAEMEMWLHGEPLNAARARRGAPPISALWIWGGEHPFPVAPAPPNTPRGEAIWLAGADPFVAALARETGRSLAIVPPGIADLRREAAHAIVVLSPMSGQTRTTLADVDREWFGGARRLLAGGDVERIGIVANDVRFEVARGAGFRFWRRHRHWTRALSAQA
jgi:hypothetical protein